MSLKKVEDSITAVLKSLADTPRTAYEVDNLYLLNCERIAAARAAMADMSGDYIDQLRARCNEAAKQAEAKHAQGASGAATTASDNAFSLDFEMEEAEAANVAELEAAKVAAGGNKKNSKKTSGKTKSKKSKVGAGDAKEEAEEKNATDALASEAVSAQTPAPAAATAVGKDSGRTTPVPHFAVLDRQENLHSAEIPTVLTTSGRSRCEPVPNTPLARLYFTETMDWDGVTCQCAVEVYRCIAVALAYGETQLSWQECQKKVQAQLAAGLSTGKGNVSTGGSASSAGGAASAESSAGQEKNTPMAPTVDDAEESGDEEADEDLTLSEQLVAEYEQAQQAEAEQDLDTSALPRDVTERMQRRLRGFSDEVWVILLCHGGYFAGGVFARGTCVLHKAFQRYVVRKKQGGKQSSNAKDAGSYNSVGSQIRAAQEVKWRVDVRDILLEWTPYIQAANFILYAAPGPQNRAVLTDFSLLPAVAALGGSKGVSPILLKDRRVSRVPITTHRPNFEEVQRIYNVCSRCALLYGKDDEAA